MEEKKNVYGVVLAGGVGARMGNVEKPKQFMEVAGKPILVLCWKSSSCIRDLTRCWCCLPSRGCGIRRI